MVGDIIADSLKLGLGYAVKLIAGVSAADFGRFARVDGQVVESNHPAWVYGHLSVYAPRIIMELDADPGDLRVSDEWLDVFSAKGKCQDDPDGTIYPPMDKVVATLLNGYRATEEVLRTTPDEKFAEPNPNEAMRSRFATIGSMHCFYAGGHFMLHMGQVSAWRRMMGLGPA